jgi:hypothetical protein
MFTAIYGEDGKNTPAGFIVETQNNLDQLLANYLDGKPKKSYFDLGDYTVLSKSAAQDADAEKLKLDHGSLIYKKDGIKKILDSLNISYKDSQIVEGKGTNISSSLIFMIKSPATITVEFDSSIYGENDGIIFIPDAKSGNYNLKVEGTDKGKYEVVVGQISEKKDFWESINGETNVSQVDDYNMLYDSPSPSPTPIIFPTVTSVIPTPFQVTLPQPTSFPEEVLGISSYQKKFITPLVKVTKKTETKKPSVKCFILSSLIISLLTMIGWYLGKKILL